MAEPKIFDSFTQCYPLSKTLRFELRPQGKTLDYIKERGVVEDDKQRTSDYVEVKKLIDLYHKDFISRTLNAEDLSFDWQALEKALEDYRNASNPEQRSKTRANLNKAQDSLRKAIAKLFTKAQEYKQLWGKDFIEEILPAFIKESGNTDKLDCCFSFKGYSAYFSGFWDVRRNLYTEEEKSNSIAYRTVNENYTKFFNARKIFEKAERIYPEAVRLAECSLSSHLNGVPLASFFAVSAFNKYLSQEGIVFFNELLGGWTTETEKIKGLNEFLNEAYLKDQNPERRRLRIEPLYKQILSDIETSSFYFDEYTTDRQMADAINAFTESMNNVVNQETGEVASVGSYILAAFESFEDFDWNKIYIDAKNYSKFSQELFGQWNLIDDVIEECREKGIGPVSGMKKASAGKWASGYISIADLEEALHACDKNFSWDTLSRKANEIISKCAEAHDGVPSILVKTTDSSRLQQNNKDLAVVKGYLDAVQNLLHFVKLFKVSADLERDDTFYYNIDTALFALDGIIPVYNKTRNRLTKKVYDETKIKLNFNCPTLASGWDISKEKTNNSIILRRGDKFYLGIFNPKNKPSLILFKDDPLAGDDCFLKMNYKLLPGANKMLPKVALSKKGVKVYDPSKEILEGYAAGKHKKGEAFDLEFCHKLIDFFKYVISTNPDWQVFDFNFSPTESYADISGFYREVEAQGYKLSFSSVSSALVEELVDNGQLYLFQIYNKDFSENSHGLPSLHTLYFCNLFTQENLNDVVYKLSGGAEVFFRPASINAPYTHKKGEKTVDKWITMPDGLKVPISDDAYMEIFNHVNNKSDKPLSDKAQSYLNSGMVKIHDVEFDLVKDRRFSQDKFMLHVPVAINFKSSGMPLINKDALQVLHDNPDVNVIGVDRGERNLLYVTVVNQQGEILEQRSLNVVNGYNYRQKLAQRENKRQQERRSWKSVSDIKKLKEGYLSIAVREVIDLMIKYNAILVLEDLNYGYKKGRYKFEKQVYQKFERMLIEKLNYFIYDKNQSNALTPGGVLRGYQLTSRFESFATLGKQSGFLFYVPTWYTAQIDPTTGFVNLFGDKLKYRNERETKAFFAGFNRIAYNAQENHFEFSFDYNRMGVKQEDPQNSWTVCSNSGERIVYVKEKERWIAQNIDVNAQLKDLFEKANVEYKNEFDLRDAISGFSVSECKTLLFCFKTLMQIVNKPAIESGEDSYILSPVKNSEGKFFNSKFTQNENLPANGDANVSYCIALKGVQLLKQQIVPDETRGGFKLQYGDRQIYNWLKWIQEKEFRV